MKRHKLTVPGRLGTSYMKRLDMLLPKKTRWLDQQPGLSPTGWFSHTTPQGSIPPRGLLLPSGPWSEGPWIGSTLTKKEVMFPRDYYLLSKLQISQEQCMEWKEAWQFLTCRNLSFEVQLICHRLCDFLPKFHPKALTTWFSVLP